MNRTVHVLAVLTLTVASTLALCLPARATDVPPRPAETTRTVTIASDDCTLSVRDRITTRWYWHVMPSGHPGWHSHWHSYPVHQLTTYVHIPGNHGFGIKGCVPR